MSTATRDIAGSPVVELYIDGVKTLVPLESAHRVLVEKYLRTRSVQAAYVSAKLGLGRALLTVRARMTDSEWCRVLEHLPAGRRTIQNAMYIARVLTNETGELDVERLRVLAPGLDVEKATFRTLLQVAREVTPGNPNRAGRQFLLPPHPKPVDDPNGIEPVEDEADERGAEWDEDDDAESDPANYDGVDEPVDEDLDVSASDNREPVIAGRVGPAATLVSSPSASGVKGQSPFVANSARTSSTSASAVIEAKPLQLDLAALYEECAARATRISEIIRSGVGVSQAGLAALTRVYEEHFRGLERPAVSTSE